MTKKRSKKGAGRIDVPRLESTVRALLELDVAPYLPGWMQEEYRRQLRKVTKKWTMPISMLKRLAILLTGCLILASCSITNCDIPDMGWVRHTADERYIIFTKSNQYGTSEINILHASTCKTAYHSGYSMSHMEGSNNGRVVALAPKTPRLIVDSRTFVDLELDAESRSFSLETGTTSDKGPPMVMAAAWSIDESFLSYIVCTRTSRQRWEFADCALYIALGNGTQAQKVAAIDTFQFDNSLFDWTSNGQVQILRVGNLQYEVSLVGQQLVIDDQSPSTPAPDPTPAGEHTVMVWNASSGQALRTLKEDAPTTEVVSVSFSSDGKTLVSATRDHIQLWDVASGQTLSMWEMGEPRDFVVISPDGKTLASATRDHIQLWDVASGQVLSTQVHSMYSSPSIMVFSPNGKVLALPACSTCHSVLLWDVTGGQEPDIVQTGRVSTLTFSPDGRTLAIVDSDLAITHLRDGRRLITGRRAIVTLLDVASGQVWRTLALDRGVSSLAFSPDGQILASGGDGVTLWHMASGQALHMLEGYSVSNLAFSPDGRTLAAGGNIVIVWDVASGTRLYTLIDGHADGVSSLVFSPDGKLLVSVSGESGYR